MSFFKARKEPELKDLRDYESYKVDTKTYTFHPVTEPEYRLDSAFNGMTLKQQIKQEILKELEEDRRQQKEAILMLMKALEKLL